MSYRTTLSALSLRLSKSLALFAITFQCLSLNLSLLNLIQFATAVLPNTNFTKILLNSTRFPDAVCMDGTQAYIYVKESTSTPKSNRWVFYLQGGGSCSDQETCEDRSEHHIQGSSDGWYDVLPPNWLALAEHVTSFHDHNLVYQYYCDGNFHLGRALASNNTWGLNFAGNYIVNASLTLLIEDYGLGTLSNPSTDNVNDKVLLLTGTSAGASGVYHSALWFKQFLDPYNVKLAIIPEGAIFISTAIKEIVMPALATNPLIPAITDPTIPPPQPTVITRANALYNEDCANDIYNNFGYNNSDDLSKIDYKPGVGVLNPPMQNNFGTCYDIRNLWQYLLRTNDIPVFIVWNRWDNIKPHMGELLIPPSQTPNIEPSVRIAALKDWGLYHERMFNELINEGGYNIGAAQKTKVGVYHPACFEHAPTLPEVRINGKSKSDAINAWYAKILYDIDPTLNGAANSDPSTYQFPTDTIYGTNTNTSCNPTCCNIFCSGFADGCGVGSTTTTTTTTTEGAGTPPTGTWSYHYDTVYNVCFALANTGASLFGRVADTTLETCTGENVDGNPAPREHYYAKIDGIFYTKDISQSTGYHTASDFSTSDKVYQIPKTLFHGSGMRKPGIRDSLENPAIQVMYSGHGTYYTLPGMSATAKVGWIAQAHMYLMAGGPITDMKTQKFSKNTEMKMVESYINTCYNTDTSECSGEGVTYNIGTYKYSIHGYMGPQYTSTEKELIRTGLGNADPTHKVFRQMVEFDLFGIGASKKPVSMRVSKVGYNETVLINNNTDFYNKVVGHDINGLQVIFPSASELTFGFPTMFNSGTVVPGTEGTGNPVYSYRNTRTMSIRLNFAEIQYGNDPSQATEWNERFNIDYLIPLGVDVGAEDMLDPDANFPFFTYDPNIEICNSNDGSACQSKDLSKVIQESNQAYENYDAQTGTSTISGGGSGSSSSGSMHKRFGGGLGTWYVGSLFNLMIGQSLSLIIGCIGNEYSMI